MEAEIKQVRAPNQNAVCPGKLACRVVEYDFFIIWGDGKTKGVLVETGTPNFLAERN